MLFHSLIHFHPLLPLIFMASIPALGSLQNNTSSPAATIDSFFDFSISATTQPPQPKKFGSFYNSNFVNVIWLPAPVSRAARQPFARHFSTVASKASQLHSKKSRHERWDAFISSKPKICALLICQNIMGIQFMAPNLSKNVTKGTYLIYPRTSNYQGTLFIEGVGMRRYN